MIIYQTLEFSDELKKMTKSGFEVKKEILIFFNATSIEQSKKEGNRIFVGEGMEIRKISLPDRKNKTGKSYGFRMFYAVLKEEIYLLRVYSKKEKKDLTQTEKKQLPYRFIEDYMERNFTEFQ